MITTPEEDARVRAAEHQFCADIDLKVKPETYDGSHHTTCIIGQLALANGLVTIRKHWLGWDTALCDAHGHLTTGLDLCELVANHYDVDIDQVYGIYRDVAAYDAGDIVHDLENAKRKVVARYMFASE